MDLNHIKGKIHMEKIILDNRARERLYEIYEFAGDFEFITKAFFNPDENRFEVEWIDLEKGTSGTRNLYITSTEDFDYIMKGVK